MNFNQILSVALFAIVIQESFKSAVSIETITKYSKVFDDYYNDSNSNDSTNNDKTNTEKTTTERWANLYKIHLKFSLIFYKKKGGFKRKIFFSPPHPFSSLFLPILIPLIFLIPSYPPSKILSPNPSFPFSLV